MQPTEETKHKISETMKKRGIKPSVLPGKEQSLLNLAKAWISPNTGRKKGSIPWNKDKEYKAVAGEKNGNWKGGTSKSFCACGNEKGRKAKTCWNCFLSSKKNKGENHYKWKGGEQNPLKLLRSSYEYKKWRQEVFKRDHWTCQICGIKGKKIWADHIKPFALYPDLRFDVNNGRTLCVDCSLKLPTHGNRVFNAVLEME